MFLCLASNDGKKILLYKLKIKNISWSQSVFGGEDIAKQITNLIFVYVQKYLYSFILIHVLRCEHLDEIEIISYKIYTRFKGRSGEVFIICIPSLLSNNLN